MQVFLIVLMPYKYASFIIGIILPQAYLFKGRLNISFHLFIV
jgi:hypothetical protein